MLPSPTRSSRIGLNYLEYYQPHDTYHPGIDFNWGASPNADLGQDVICPARGIVVYVSPKGFNGGLGNYVVVRHPHLGVWTRYLHLDETAVKVGWELKRGERIGTLGNSGTTTAHLHFEVLNESGLAFVRDWHRPYGRYPAGLSRKEVAAMFLDPSAWLRDTVNPEARLSEAETEIPTASGLRLSMLLRLVKRLRRILGV